MQKLKYADPTGSWDPSILQMISHSFHLRLINHPIYPPTPLDVSLENVCQKHDHYRQGKIWAVPVLNQALRHEDISCLTRHHAIKLVRGLEV